MRIFVANLTLRFYKDEGWTIPKIQELLADPSLEVTTREIQWQDTVEIYYAVYEKSGHKVFKTDIFKHEFVNPFKNDISWYIQTR